MAYRLLAVFDEDMARAPVGVNSFTEHRTRNVFDETENQEMQAQCDRSLQSCYERCQPSSRRMIKLRRTGFALEACSSCQYASRDGIHALFAGDELTWPEVMVEGNASRGSKGPGTEAEWVLDLYESFKDYSLDEDITDAALRALAKIQGNFGFILYDEELLRVLAARDRNGGVPLHWGVTADGRFLMGTDLLDLEQCNPSATPFPPGCLYASQGSDLSRSPGSSGWVMPSAARQHGHIAAFVESQRPGKRWRELKVIPRVTEEGTLCGAVYKVASEHNMTALTERHIGQLATQEKV